MPNLDRPLAADGLIRTPAVLDTDRLHGASRLKAAGRLSWGERRG